MKLLKPLKTKTLQKPDPIGRALTKLSLKQSQKSLDFKPRSRKENGLPTTRVKLNLSGNRRGMHMAENPPDSEEMKRRRAMRRLWNKRMPSLHCSNCQFSSQCPQFRSGYECAFLPFLNSHSIESEGDLIFYAKELCGENIKRAQLMLLMERLSGAKPDLDTSEALSHVFQQLMQLHERMTDKGDTSLEIESSDGTIIGKLFGSLDNLLGKTQEAYENPPDIAISHSGETAIDVSSEQVPSDPELLAAPVKKADANLLRELSIFKGLPEAPVNVSTKPVQEELNE